MKPGHKSAKLLRDSQFGILSVRKNAATAQLESSDTYETNPMRCGCQILAGIWQRKFQIRKFMRWSG